MIPLSRIAGVAADRVLGLPSAAAPYVVRPNVAVPMPDGVALLGDHYRPAGPDRPLPVVLIRSPYGRAGLTGYLFAAPLARRGFQVFIQSTRGTFGSGGQFPPFLAQRGGGLAPLAWRLPPQARSSGPGGRGRGGGFGCRPRRWRGGARRSRSGGTSSSTPLPATSSGPSLTMTAPT